MAIAPPGPRLTGALLVSSAVVVTVAFAGLGSAFDSMDDQTADPPRPPAPAATRRDVPIT